MQDSLISSDESSINGLDIYGDLLKSYPKVVESLAPNSLKNTPNESDINSDKVSEKNNEFDILTIWRNTQNFNYNDAPLENNDFEQTSNHTKYMEIILGN